uniref:Uncharacterized protein n=1 Tax=Triticum urartu TaxID=4572 RepID=A0A8R7PP28_TRIUA
MAEIDLFVNDFYEDDIDLEAGALLLLPANNKASFTFSLPTSNTSLFLSLPLISCYRETHCKCLINC